MHRIYTTEPEGGKPPERPAELPRPWRESMRPWTYKPGPGLEDAVNVALLLGQPLLVTGEPGTGKTQLASHVAWRLGLGKPLVFQTKSTSTARDFFYEFDVLGRFQAAQLRMDRQDVEFINYNALGLAILLANPREAVTRLLPAGFVHDGPPRRSVVLIDEVDKAPRDFPNDILSEVENMAFRIPELGSVVVEAEPEMQPVLIMSSNSEKSLPDAFLRRCVYYNIPFPDRAKLLEIIHARIGDASAAPAGFLSDALDFFEMLRAPGTNLRKKPATAELLSWLILLYGQIGRPGQPLRQYRGELRATMSALVKSAEDQIVAERVLSSWIEEGGGAGKR
jgi:MoxR-like ATPase